MVVDFVRIFNLISDLIFLYHPITLDIRYLFCSRLNNKCWNSREEWEEYIIQCCNYKLGEVIGLIFRDKRFRKNIIKVLEIEKSLLIESHQDGT